VERDSYRVHAKFYDKVYEPAANRLRAAGAKLCPPRKNLAVLDVACGTGTQLRRYRMEGCKLCGIDSSPAMLERAKAKLGDSAELLLMDASHMTFADGTFDLVTIVLTLHEMPPALRTKVVRECRRVTKPGGHLMLIDYHNGPYPFLRGWLWKIMVTLSEISAGRRHFANYRDFLKRRGLQSICEEQGVAATRKYVVDSGVAAIYVL
jgi:ubiquinone/menaquinone biosynthesis C-methylase UbiE